MHRALCNLRYRYLLFVAAAMAPSHAHAHAMFGSAAPFWSGVLHFLVTPMALAAIVGLVIVVAGAAEIIIFWSVLSAASATFLAVEAAGAIFIAVEIAPATWQLIAPLSVATVGLIAVSGYKPPRWLTIAIAAISGAAAGIAVGTDAQDWGSSVGAAVTTLVLASWGATGLLRLQAINRLSSIIPIARRILGAWIAAITMLISALAIKGL